MIEIEEQLSGKHVLVTGAGGFIGSRLVKALLDLGAEPVAVVDDNTNLTRLEPVLANPKLRLEFPPGEKGKYSWGTKDRWQNIDLVAHLGLRVPAHGDYCRESRDNVNLNLLPTIDLIESLPSSVQGICFASSVSVYGSTHNLMVKEEDAPYPLSSYGATKLAIEQYLRTYGQINQIPVTILRYSTVYGSGETKHRAIPVFLNALMSGEPPLIYGDGSEIRDYVHVDDVVQATIRSLVRRPARVLNIASGQGHSSLEIARLVIRLCSVDVKPHFVPNNVQDYSLICDISAAQQTLDYSPQVSLEEGLKQEVEWYFRKTQSNSSGEIPPTTGVSTEKEGATKRSGYLFWKGIVDCLLAACAIVVALPVLFLIAVMIWLDSRGNPIFMQERVGKDGRLFKAYKFRTMPQNNNEDEYKAYLCRYVLGNAPYRVDENGRSVYKVDGVKVTKLGSFLRKTNLDELPQFVNVLKGEMSFIGPRPDIPFAVRMYNDWHRGRLSVKPGITGLWQVRNRKSLSFEDMVRLDLEYIKKQSPILDTKIVFLTVRTILSQDGS